MDDLTGAAVFFDIGDTLASVTLAPSGDRIARLDVFPYVPGVLGALRDGGAQLGILSDPGHLAPEAVDAALTAGGLADHFRPDLVRYGPKDAPDVFAEAATAAGSGRVLFVGEDARERSLALRAGLAVAPHPLLAVSVLQGKGPLRYVRVTVPPG